MVKLCEYLKENIKNMGSYALVKYDGVEEAVWFSYYASEDWYLESPCQLYTIAEVNKEVNDFCTDYVENYLDLELTTCVDSYIEEFVKPCIIDNVLYEIVNFQTGPFLPKEVESIKLISERDCIKFLLKK